MKVKKFFGKGTDFWLGMGMGMAVCALLVMGMVWKTKKTFKVDDVQVKVGMPVEQKSNWMQYEMKALGVKFELPKELVVGDMVDIVKNGDVGSVVCFETASGSIGAWCGLGKGKIVFGATSVDFQEGRGGSFNDIAGYVKVGSKVYWGDVIREENLLSEDEYQFKTNKYGVGYVLLTGKSVKINGNPFPAYGGLEQGLIGALVNVPNNTAYKGMTVMMDTADAGVTMQLLDQVMQTVRF